MAQPGTASRIVLSSIWLPLGVAMIAVPVWLGWTRWSVILNGHPVTLVAAILCALIGLVAVVWAIASLILGARYDREVQPGQPGHRTRQQLKRRAEWRLVLGIPALAICLVLVGGLAWLRPFGATAVALDAVRSGDDVRVTDRFTWYEMQSMRKNTAGVEVKPTVGLVFYPGARVDARAYAHLLKPLAAAGFLVVVLKEPLGIALTDANQAETVLEVHPNISAWVVGGHSLGGVAASSFADTHAPRVKGLLLYASYPAAKLVRTDLSVVSIAGSDDGLATPSKVAAAKPDLPVRTQYVTVTGGVHAFFGDYGDQPGDGVAAVPRATAQAQIVAASRALMASLQPRPKKK